MKNIYTIMLFGFIHFEKSHFEFFLIHTSQCIKKTFFSIKKTPTSVSDPRISIYSNKVEKLSAKSINHFYEL